MADAFFPPVVATFVASTGEATAELTRLAESFERTGAVVTESTRAAGVSATTMGAETTAATSEIVAANSELVSSTARVAASIGSASEEWATSYAAMAATTAELSAGMEMEMVKAGAAAEAMATKIDAAAASTVATTEGKLAQLKKTGAIVAAGAAIVGAEFVHMAGDFESATQRLVSSAGETEANLGLVRDGLLAMAGQVGNTTEELAKAMYIVESGGQHGANGLTVLKAAAQGAKTEGADLTTVADALTSVLQDYHLKADQSALVTSKLVAAVGAGKTTFQEFTGSLSSILPIASSAKISLDDILGALASMTVHGMSAAQASQNMADAVKHMVAPTQVQAKELGQLGLSAQDLAGMLSEKGLTGTLNVLTETILKHMGPSGKVMLDAFNQSKDAAGAVKAMIASMPPDLQKLATAYVNGSMSAKEWSMAIKGLPTNQAELAKQFAALEDRARGFSDQLKSGQPAAQSYQDALRRVMGDATGLNVALMLTGENTDYVTGAVKTVTDATTEADGSVKGWSEIQGTFNQKLSQAKASTEALGVAIGQRLLPVASAIIGAFATGARWLADHKAAAIALSIVLGGALVIGLSAAMVAVWGFITSISAATLITSGIVVGIGVLIAGIVLLATHWSQVWNGIKDLAGTVWNWLKSNIFKPIGDAIDGVGTVLEIFKARWDAAWHAIGDAIMWVWNHSIGWVIEQIKKGIEIIHQFISALSSAQSSVSGPHVSGLTLGILGFDDGGWVPGFPGQPQLSVTHGHEYVLSQDMLSGRAAPDPAVMQMLSARFAQSGTVAPLPVAARAGGGGAVTVVNVNVAGSVLAERDLRNLVQQTTLRYNLRNTGNGLSVAGA